MISSKGLEHAKIETALRESEERLRLAIEASGIGIFSIDLSSGVAHYSPELSRILGFPAVAEARLEDAFVRVLSRRAGARAQTVRGGARSRERRPVGYEFPVRSPRRRGALDELERPRSFRRGVSPAQAGQHCGYLRRYHRAPRSRGPPASQRSTTDIRSPSAHQIEFVELAFVANGSSPGRARGDVGGDHRVARGRHGRRPAPRCQTRCADDCRTAGIRCRLSGALSRSIDCGRVRLRAGAPNGRAHPDRRCRDRRRVWAIPHCCASCRLSFRPVDATDRSRRPAARGAVHALAIAIPAIRSRFAQIGTVHPTGRRLCRALPARRAIAGKRATAVVPADTQRSIAAAG